MDGIVWLQQVVQLPVVGVSKAPNGGCCQQNGLGQQASAVPSNSSNSSVSDNMQACGVQES
jgi:hypothetical protein